jgi:hypothetical protein
MILKAVALETGNLSGVQKLHSRRSDAEVQRLPALASHYDLVAGTVKHVSLVAGTVEHVSLTKRAEESNGSEPSDG